MLHNSPLRRRLLRLSVILALGFSLSAGIAYFQTKSNQPTRYNKIEPLSDGVFGGTFSLTDHLGQKRTDRDLAGSYRLIFFGFTYCPAVCPTELSKIQTVLEELGQEDAAKIRPVFITVDPERDTPEVIRDYITQFDARMIGLTGSREEIDQVLEQYKIYAGKVEMEGMDGYMVDHSAFTYFIAPDGRLLALFKPEDTPEDIITSIQGWFSALEGA